jgi:integrase/recombinase XerD
MQIVNEKGERLYFTEEQRKALLGAAAKAPREVRSFCSVLCYTGCRISEALALTAKSIDLSAKVIVIESLKKRKAGVHRQVPVPPELLDTLDMVHGIREIQRKGRARLNDRLWTWSRMTAWRKMAALMKAAGIPDGPHASPKGLRHGFGVAAVSKGISLNMVQKWLGHSQLTTTAIYANAVGEEEQSIASKMWT